MKNTSIEAYKSITLESKSSMWSKIVTALKRNKTGLTADQLAEKLKVDHVQISRRMGELRKAGIVIDTPVRRKTRTGRRAIVRMISKKAA